MERSEMITVTVNFKIWSFKYFTPDKFLFIIVANGEPIKAIEVG